MRLVEYATTNSEMRHVVLSDSTQVWLSAGSVLFCPEKFMGKTREVYLSGEAFFHVQKADCPFRVNTDKLSADISEATFGITAYPDMEEVMTTLLDGKFVLSFKNRKQFLADETGIRYDYNATNNRLIKTSVNLDKIAWGMKGYLVFQGVSIGQFKILGTKQISELSITLKQKADEANYKVAQELPNKKQEVLTSVGTLLANKENYFRVANISTETELSEATIEESYNAEYLYLKIGTIFFHIWFWQSVFYIYKSS